jgi:hypothetical protein
MYKIITAKYPSHTSKINAYLKDVSTVVKIGGIGLTYREYADIVNVNQMTISCGNPSTKMTKFLRFSEGCKISCNTVNSTIAYFRKLYDVDQLTFAEIDSWSMSIFDMVER